MAPAVCTHNSSTQRIFTTFIFEVPLQRTDGFSFYSDRTGQDSSEAHVQQTRMGFRAQFHRKSVNIYYSRRRTEHSLLWVQQALSVFSRSYGKIHPRTDHKGPEVEQRYSSTLSLTSALDGVGSERHAPAALPPGE
jgi:hypothetical protein